MRTLRNIAIVALLALIVAAVPGGGNAARAIITALTIAFLIALGLGGYELYRQNRLTYLSLEERHRTTLLIALGAISLMIAGADELLESGPGLLLWIAVLGVSVFAIVNVWSSSQTY